MINEKIVKCDYHETSGIRPSTPDTNKVLLALMAWEYGPRAAGALSVITASLMPTHNTNNLANVQSRQRITFISSHNISTSAE